MAARFTINPTAISASTRLAGVIGSPISHSKSPNIHNAAFQKVGFDAIYLAFEVGSEELVDMLAAYRTLNFVGLSVTMPLKEVATEHVDLLTPTAKKLGALNTIYTSQSCAAGEGKKLVGDNTDGEGFIRALKDELGVDLDGANVAILGAGGAARSILLACSDAKTSHITVINRNKERRSQALSLAPEITTAQDTASEAATKALEIADVIINATPIGMGSTGGSPVDLTQLRSSDTKTVCDLIYYPQKTPLLRQAEELGYRTQNGLAMLIHQAAIQFEHFTQTQAPIDVMKQAATAN